MEKKKMRNQIEVRVSHIMFYLFLFFMFFIKGIGLYDGQTLYRLLFWFAMLCAAGKIFLTNYTKQQWIWVIALGVLAVLIERHSGEKGVLICYAIVIGMKEIPLKRIMQVGAATFGITMCGMVTYYGIFLEQSTYKVTERVGLGETIRYALGYPHPNNLLVTYLATITMLIYCKGRKYNWKHAIFLMLVNIYLYTYCLSYTGLITCSLIILLPLYLMNLRKNKLGIFEYTIGAFSVPLCLFYSFLVPYILPQEVMDFLLDKIVTYGTRLIYAKRYVIPENISLLGTRVAEVTTSEYSLDNSFLYAFIFNGVLFFTIVIVAYIFLMYRLIKERRDLEIIICCVFFLEALLEPFMFNTSFKNVTLFFLGDVIWNNIKCTEGKINEIKIKVPKCVERLIDRSIICWNKWEKNILLISAGITGVIMFEGLVWSIVNKMMDIYKIREKIALGCLMMMVSAAIVYVVYYYRENCCKKEVS